MQDRRQRCCATEQSDCRQQKSTYSPNPLCVLERLEEPQEAAKKWKKQIEWFTSITKYREFGRIDGEPKEFEWKIFQDSLHFRLSKKKKRYH